MRRHAIAGAAILILISASTLLAQDHVQWQSLVPVAQSSVVQPAVQVPVGRTVTLRIANAPVWQALDILFRGTGLTYTVDPQVAGLQGMITVDLNGVPFEMALQIVTRNAGLGVLKEGANYKIGPMVPGTSSPVPKQMVGPPGVLEVNPSGRPGAQKFDITLDKANVLEAMKQILEVARQNYVIDTGLDSAWAGPLGPKISAKMRGVALDEVLGALGKSANLVLARVNSIYTVRPPDGALPFSYIGGSATGKGAGSKAVPGTQTKTDLPACAKCSRSLDPTWLYCPQCGAQVTLPAVK